MSTIERRRQELEEKKRKLAEMKKAREDRMAMLSASSTSGNGEVARSATPLTAGRKDIDDLVNNLLGPQTTVRPVTPGLASRTVSGASVARSVDAASTAAVGSSRAASPMPARTQTIETAVDGESSRSSPPATPSYEMKDSHVELYELPTKPSITYSRGIQTTSTSTGSDSDEPDPDRDRQSGRETEAEMRQRLQAEFEAERDRLERAIREEEEQKRRDEAKITELSEEERRNILQGQEFARFVDDSSKIIQRALNDGYDYVKDYRATIDDVQDDSEQREMKLACTFKGDWTAGRSVTALEWSPKYAELCAAAYNRNPTTPNAPDGTVAIWNMHLLDRPEFTFHAQSDVLSIAFSPFHPNHIYGGTYSGQVLQWDTRAKSLPVLKTPSSGQGHRYPIYAMRVVGSQNAHSLVTSSTDGTVCGWLPDLLAQPQECIELAHPGQYKTNELAITSMDFPDKESSEFWIGTEEGDVYQASRFDRAGLKAGIDAKAVYRGHAGPVSALDFHPLKGAVDFSDLFLTSSLDWSVKLWRVPPANVKGRTGAVVAPLHSMDENDDYVLDVQWHSQHPAVFGTAGGSGKFEVWNLNQDVETPALSTVVADGRAINRMAWEKKEGRRAALGMTNGSVHVYDIGDMAVPQESDWPDLQRSVQAMLSKKSGTGFGRA